MNHKTVSAADFLPKTHSLPALRKASKVCHGCHLFKDATQTVFGEGAANSKIIVVGEIAGDKEDRLGHPFVGPAGTLLRNSFEETGIDMQQVYLTNVVKHFKFTYVNERRLHRTPISSEIKACKPWLDSEIEIIQPEIILCLGATAAKTLIHPKINIRENHGKWFTISEKIQGMITFHPSAILRAGSEASRHQLKKIFLKDLQKIVMALNQRN
jgi:DNA polymerase